MHLGEVGTACSSTEILCGWRRVCSVSFISDTFCFGLNNLSVCLLFKLLYVAAVFW